ncbi:S24 family peptidase (plasmid) [Serratia ureilytica]|uniref:S24 family peptidase n=1 Tax=Serratia ureilytica TaxID=300181 RepID=UPI003710FADF
MPVRLYDAGVPCGFPSPAQDYLEQRLSLDDICIRHPESTYLVRAEGQSMQDCSGQLKLATALDCK